LALVPLRAIGHEVQEHISGINVRNELPLVLAVPHAAQLLGISRAAAYRLVASS
jgi:hypothetical protein